MLGPSPNADITSNSVIYATGRFASAIDATTQKIAGFAKLAVGWDYGDGGPIARKTINLAVLFVSFLRQLGFSDIDAFPGTGGEISLGVIHGDHYLEIVVEIDQTISIGYDLKRSQEAYFPHVQHEKAQQLVIALAGRIWSTLGYFTRTSLTPALTVLRAWHSETHPTKGVYLSSTTSAFGRPARAYAPTSGGIIQHKPGTPRYSGNLTQQFYQIATE